METTGRSTIEIDATAEEVYQLVSDLDRMGDWSPECYRVQRENPGTDFEVGTLFQGYNRLGPNWWNVPCKVLAAEPGRLFEFESLTGSSTPTRWTYELESKGSTCVLTERFNAPMLAVPGTPPGDDPTRRDELLAATMLTIQRIKAAAEVKQAATR